MFSSHLSQRLLQSRIKIDNLIALFLFGWFDSVIVVDVLWCFFFVFLVKFCHSRKHELRSSGNDGKKISMSTYQLLLPT